MAQVSFFHFKGETETHFIEGDCECEYYQDDEGEDIPRRRTMAFFDVVATDKESGKSEEWGDEVPDDMLNFVRDVADEGFEVA